MSAISNLTNALKPYLDAINQIHFINDELDIR